MTPRITIPGRGDDAPVVVIDDDYRGTTIEIRWNDRRGPNYGWFTRRHRPGRGYVDNPASMSWSSSATTAEAREAVLRELGRNRRGGPADAAA